MGKKLLNAKQIFTYSKINIRFVQSWKHLVHLPETQNFYLEVKDFFFTTGPITCIVLQVELIAKEPEVESHIP